MRTHFRNRPNGLITILPILALIGLIWNLIAPVQYGGRVAYVIVTGNSMEPRYRLGDLVISTERSSYRVGDAVVYRHPEGGQVFHRIIEKDRDLFRFKGDNNSWVDSVQIRKIDIVGKLWLHIPYGGNIIQMLRTPRNLTLLAIVIMLTFSKSTKTNQSRKSKARQFNKNQSLEPEPKPSISSHIEAIIVVAVIALIAGFLGVIAFNKSLETVESHNIQYNQIGVLLYQAEDNQDLYDTELVQTGEPVFLQLTCDLQLFYGYQLVSTAINSEIAQGISGVYRVTAEISDPNGWNRTLELAPQTDFRGSEFTASMHLDLCHIRNLVAEMEEKSGSKNNWYSLTIYPKTVIMGQIGDHPLNDSFTPEIKFEVNSNMMRVPTEFNGHSEDNFEPMKPGYLPGMRVKLNSLNIFGLELPVITARMISSVVLALSVLVILWLGWPLYQEWKRGDASRIRVQYEPMLVDVQPGSISPNGQAVPVDSFDDLAKLAERYGAMILCETTGDIHKYWVQDGEVMYEFALEPSERGLEGIESASLNNEILGALEADQFQLFYQPIVTTTDGQIEGFEALLRWFHPEKGVIYPAEFIAQAEEHGLMDQVDNWVIEKACLRLKSWKDEGVRPVIISVNVSPQRFLDPEFIKRFSKIIKRCECDARYLQLEINRANLIIDEDVAILNLNKLKNMGVLLAIDNFTASNSNQVDAVTRLPVNSLKIDRKLLNRILMKPEDSRLIGAVVKMAQDLELHVVAEGVETQEQLDYLGEHQVDAAQGYFTGRPMSVEDITQILVDNKPISQG
jgi:signal peptidase I